MSSFNGLKNIAATSIQNSGEIYLGSDIDPGIAGQALVSGGPNEPARWDTHTGTIQPLTIGTNLSLASGNPTFNGGTPDTLNATDTQLNLTGGDGITITNTGGLNRTIETDNDEITISNSGGQNEVLKVPNDLTFTGYATGTYNGSGSLNINLVDTDTTYSAGNGIQISGSNQIQTKTDNQTIRDSGGGSGNNLEVIKVPNDLTAGTNITFSSGTTYNGSAAITISALDTDTTYKGGKNISIDTTTTPDTINLDADLTNIDTITFTSTPSAGATALTGNDYPAFGYQTPMTYFDLRSTTNLIPGAVLATKVQRTYILRSFSNVYSEYSSNFRTSFVAQSANVMVEFRALVRADNKVFYGGLYDYNAGSYNADTRNRFNYNDETDQDHTVLTWWMRNLTPGSTYYISPYFRGSSSTVYIYAGHSGSTDSFAPGIMRIIDGGNNVNIY